MIICNGICLIDMYAIGYFFAVFWSSLYLFVPINQSIDHVEVQAFHAQGANWARRPLH